MEDEIQLGHTLPFTFHTYFPASCQRGKNVLIWAATSAWMHSLCPPPFLFQQNLPDPKDSLPGPSSLWHKQQLPLSPTHFPRGFCNSPSQVKQIPDPWFPSVHWLCTKSATDTLQFPEFSSWGFHLIQIVCINSAYFVSWGMVLHNSFIIYVLLISWRWLLCTPRLHHSKISSKKGWNLPYPFKGFWVELIIHINNSIFFFFCLVVDE